MKTLITLSLVIFTLSAMGQQKFTKWEIHFAEGTQVVALTDTMDQVNRMTRITFKVGQDVCDDQLRFIAATDDTRDTFEIYHIPGTKKQVAFFTDGKLNLMKP